MDTDTYVGPRDGCGFLHRHECDGAACDGSKAVPNDSDPFTGPDTDDTRREDEPGDWLMSGFSGVCSRGGEWFHLNGTIRADSDGGWECQDCVMHDDMVHATVDGKCQGTNCRLGVCA